MYILGILFRRLIQGVFVVLFTALIIFTLLRVVPGDPVRLIVGGMAPDSVVEQIAQKMGLRDPIPVQFGRYLWLLGHGDLGQSYVRPKTGAVASGAEFVDPTKSQMASVGQLILTRLPYTLQLATCAIAIALIVSFAIGVPAGLAPGRWPDKVAFFISSMFVSIPSFWLAIVLALIITVRLQWLPSIGYRDLTYTILPAIVLSVEIIPFLVRTLTVSISQLMKEEFVTAGEVRGLPKHRIVSRHVLRNASVPLLNLLGVQISTLLGGVLVIEYIFDYPGLGQLTVNAVLQRDFPLIQGIAILTSFIFVFVNIVVDIVATSIDPRMEY
ncbi:ABC transporter permease [Bradyrhizobium tropiciagri]|uniref:ABC transporter permease n=1 Tax=Bradyrhizobium tropiciagri TaxID=312253 RepID=UPI001BAE4C60|nr:ABC transporter permease [Bradyrhizobium tropiciagri]MBR0898989.1 ABC transporter permease [Bradyrhizobium tropiciagri]